MHLCWNREGLPSRPGPGKGMPVAQERPGPYSPILQDWSLVVWLTVLTSFLSPLKDPVLAPAYLSCRTEAWWSGWLASVLWRIPSGPLLTYPAGLEPGGLADCPHVLPQSSEGSRPGPCLPILQDWSLVVWLTVLTSFLSPLKDPVLASLVMLPRFLFSFLPRKDKFAICKKFNLHTLSFWVD